MLNLILAVSSLLLAVGCYYQGMQKGREEGRGERRLLEAENRRLRFGGSIRDPFLAPDRLTGDRSARRIYR